jgi:hypothetical protein
LNASGIRRALALSAVVAVGSVGVAVAKDLTPAEEGALPMGSAQLQHHGPNTDHLPPTQSNIDVIGQLRLTDTPGGIADVAYYKGYAYLNAWSPECKDAANPLNNRGGFHAVDIRDPAKPKKVAYVPALPDTYHGEGAHVITLDTPNFKGDVLAVNNETCSNVSTDPAKGQGGMDLYDVTDPANPKILVQGFGDRGPDDENKPIDPTGLSGPALKANSSHSTFIWQAGAKAYAVQVDNQELHDVDIFDITNPRAPQPVVEYDLAAAFPQIVSNSAWGDSIFHHDMVVKNIGGKVMLFASYWDAGYVQVDITDPLKPVYVGDSDFASKDPLTPGEPPEGNGHQGELSFDNKYFLAADEDFGPYRVVLKPTTGPYANQQYPVGQATESSGQLGPDATVAGKSYYIGRACGQTGGDTLPAPPQANTIAIIQRGTCTFQEKTESAAAAGYVAAVIFNSTAAGNGCDSLVTMAFTNYNGGIPAMFVARSVGFKLLKAYDPATYACTPGDPANSTAAPAGPSNGEDINMSNYFDGWGYAHLYETKAGKWSSKGEWAVPEAIDSRFASGFGALSIHEHATDPTEYLSYVANYAAGMRVLKFGPGGLEQMGAFIDKDGNDFWGVEQFTTGDGKRLFLGSDRDYGLYVLEYVGPGAAQAPACKDITAIAAPGAAVTVPLSCADANNNPLTLATERAPANGTVSAVSGGNVTYTSKAGFNGVDTFTYSAFDGAAKSKPAQVTVLVGRCANRIDGTPAVDLINGTPAGDSIFGKGGGDVILSAQGADCIAGEDGNDELTGAEGDDSITGGNGSDRMFGESGKDAMNGGTGSDHVRGGSGNDRLTGESGNDFLDGGSNNDTLSGGAGRDSLIGGAGNDKITGGSGNDSLDGGKGVNRLSGGSGNDRIKAANGRKDRITCGPGRDRVTADRTDTVAKDCERVSRTRRTK